MATSKSNSKPAVDWSEHKKKREAEYKKDPKAFVKKYGNPPRIQSK